ncbi:MAG: hypothetical protein AAF658_06345, partial [Myxococcota bacterium]
AQARRVGTWPVCHADADGARGLHESIVDTDTLVRLRETLATDAFVDFRELLNEAGVDVPRFLTDALRVYRSPHALGVLLEHRERATETGQMARGFGVSVTPTMLHNMTVRFADDLEGLQAITDRIARWREVDGDFLASSLLLLDRDTSEWALGPGSETIDAMADTIGVTRAAAILSSMQMARRLGMGHFIDQFIDQVLPSQPEVWASYKAVADAFGFDATDIDMLGAFAQAVPESTDGLDRWLERFEQRFPDYALPPQRWTGEKLLRALQAFDLGDAFWEYNDAMGGTEPELPPGSDRVSDLLNAAEGMGIYVDEPNMWHFSAADPMVRELSRGLESGALEGLVTALRDDWNLSTIELSGLGEMLGDPEVVAFFSDGANASAYAALAKTYDLPHVKLSELLGTYLPLHLREQLPPILTFDAGDSVSFVQRALQWPERFEHDRVLGSGSSAGDIIDIEALHLRLRLWTPERTALADELEALNVPDSVIRSLAYERFTFDRLISAGPVPAETLERLLAIHGRGEPTVNLVKAAVLLRPSPEALDAYADLVGEPGDDESLVLEADVLRALREPLIRDRVASDSFRGFVQELSDLGLRGVEDAPTRVNLAEHPELLGLDRETVERRVATLKELAAPFGLVEIPSRMLTRALSADLAGSTDDVRTWIDRLRAQGNELSPNDIPLLYEVVNRPALARRLGNPAALHRHLERVYAAREAAVRSVGLRPDEEWNERADPSTLEPLDALRAVLWDEAMEHESFRRELGVLVAADIAHGGSESGGVSELDSNGELRLRSIQPRGLDDSSYYVSGDPNFHGGVTSFHFHALEADFTGYSGPSGSLTASGGDVGFVEHVRGTDVVVTTLGHPEINGRADTSRIRVNVDLYTVDHLPKRTLQIVDLGVFTIPLP